MKKIKKLVKGAEAVVLGALNAGCDACFGYPITPASEIAELAALHYLQLGKIFVQAESEVAAVNMLYGASAAGLRAITATSGPGFSLMQEGMSCLACAELPAVFVLIMRSGPGYGNIGPEQGDYFQAVKGGGHGSYRVPVLTPNSVAEMYDLTIDAFELADQWRTPVILLADAILAQMMEPIEFEQHPIHKFDKKWAVNASKETNENRIVSIHSDPDDMEKHEWMLQRKFTKIEESVPEAEFYRTDDAEILLTGYGIVSRILRQTVERLREKGIRAGLLRPKTVWPFPISLFQSEYDKTNAPVLVVELSSGQLLEDIRLTLPNADIHFLGRLGGNLPSDDDIVEKTVQILAEKREKR